MPHIQRLDPQLFYNFGATFTQQLAAHLEPQHSLVTELCIAAEESGEKLYAVLPTVLDYFKSTWSSSEVEPVFEQIWEGVLRDTSSTFSLPPRITSALRNPSRITASEQERLKDRFHPENLTATRQLFGQYNNYRNTRTLAYERIYTDYRVLRGIAEFNQPISYELYPALDGGY